MLNDSQRQEVENTIREVCQFRQWLLHAINVRSNHVHLVLTADLAPEQVLKQLQAWGSHRLSELADLTVSDGGGNGHKRWWTEGGSTK